jgi:hypothetical protein
MGLSGLMKGPAVLNERRVIAGQVDKMRGKVFFCQLLHSHHLFSSELFILSH